MNLFNNITTKNIHGLLVFSASCALLTSVAYAEQSNKYIKAPVLSINKAQNPQSISGSVKAETVDKAEQHLPTTLKHRDRAVSKEDHKNLTNKSPGVTVNTKSHIPASSIVKQPLVQNNKSTLSKQSDHGMGNYAPIKNEMKPRTPAHSPQWSDQRSHDPGKTLLGPQISNKQLEKNIIRNAPSIGQHIAVQPDSKSYKLSPDDFEIQFSDGRSGRKPPATKNTDIPSYRTGNRSTTIDTRHRFNSDIDSVPASNNTGMTKTRQNDSENNYLQNSKTAGKKTHTGFKRKQVIDAPSGGKGSK